MQSTAIDSELPEVGAQAAEKKAFRNFVRNTDTVTVGSGYINEIRSHQKDAETTLWFVRVGLIAGTAPDETKGQGERKPEFQNADLLVGSTLKRWAEAMHASGADLSRIRVRMSIRNLRFSPGIHDGKPVLDSRGVLETLQFGYLED